MHVFVLGFIETNKRLCVLPTVDYIHSFRFYLFLYASRFSFFLLVLTKHQRERGKAIDRWCSVEPAFTWQNRIDSTTTTVCFGIGIEIVQGR